MTAHISPAEFHRRAAKQVTERDVQTAIMDWLGLMRVRAVRIDTNPQPIFGAGKSVRGLGPCSHVGMPDIYAPLPWGQACHIEVKRPGQGVTGLRPSQARWIVETHKRSPLTMILISESALDVEKILKPILDVWSVSPSMTMSASGLLMPWRAATLAAVATAKRRLERGTH